MMRVLDIGAFFYIVLSSCHYKRSDKLRYIYCLLAPGVAFLFEPITAIEYLPEETSNPLIGTDPNVVSISGECRNSLAD